MATCIDDGYQDADGQWRVTGEATRKAILAAMGGDPGSGSVGGARVRVILSGKPAPLERPAEVTLEDGGVVPVRAHLPPDLPVGYHDLRPLDGTAPVRLIVSPGQCHLPRDLRTWGWAVQLYAARSNGSWGIGDFADLRRLAHWSSEALGAGSLLVNPLHAATPVVPQEPSPYCPTSRRFRNVLYLHVEEVPGAERAGSDLAEIANAGRRLNSDRRIDRDVVLRLKLRALERLWQSFGDAGGFDRYLREQGRALREFSTFCALTERFGGRWCDWPAEYRRPDGRSVDAFAAEHGARVRFHAWIQWLLDEQLRRAGAHIAIMQDLPIGVDPHGADAWAWQDLLALGASIGAPPDRYNTAGQDWGLPPFIPHRLADAAYEPFIETIRATLRHAGGLRIDHVMGLFRLFWVPRGSSPAEGGFVRYPADVLLAIVALESHRARAVVVGEDLGTVEEGVREQLAAHRILSYRLLWFEEQEPYCYPELALAAVTTHDLPTISGLWSGADLVTQRELGLRPNEQAFSDLRRRLLVATRANDDVSVDQVVVEAYRALGKAPSAMLMATLEDALAVGERPNMPNTTVEWPNWSMALPAPIEALETAPLALDIAAALRREPPRTAGTTPTEATPRERGRGKPR